MARSFFIILDWDPTVIRYCIFGIVIGSVPKRPETDKQPSPQEAFDQSDSNKTCCYCSFVNEIQYGKA